MAAPEDSASATISFANDRAHKIRVLIVDDTPDIRDLIRTRLDMEPGFDVVGEAGDGEQAILEARRLRPDAVVLDLSMPVKDGLEALPDILEVSPESRVLVLSGFENRQMGAEAVRLGASAYMEKGGIVELLGPRLMALWPERPSQRNGPARTPAPAGASGRTPATGAGTSQEEIVSMLAHELGNPVTVVQGYAMTLQRSVAKMPPEAIQQAADAIVRGADHLASLIRAFSDLRKLEVEALDLILEPADLGELVRNCVADMAKIIQTHPVMVQTSEGVVVEVDPVRIRQVLINLISNAAKFSPQTNQIEVEMKVDSSRVEVSVRDYGPGIPAEEQGELFGKFARLGSKANGTGLGLYISRGIARAHGGDLVLAPSGGPGCKFVLSLPIAPTPMP